MSITIPNQLDDSKRTSSTESLGFVASESPQEPRCVDQVTRLTLIMMLLFSEANWFPLFVMRMVGAVGLVWPSLARRSGFWFAVAGLNLFAVNLNHWETSDNHKWLYTYWFLALATSRLGCDTQGLLERNARFLLGFAFLFAFVGKLGSPEFMDGNTFRYLLLEDSRFYEVSRLCGGYVQNPAALRQSIDALDPVIDLQIPPALDHLARFLTLWTLSIEGLIAFLFLCGRRAFGMWSHIVLIVFVLAVYPIAPVIGFAWILLILGCASLPPDSRRMRAAYLILPIAIYLCGSHHLKSTVCVWLFGNRFYVPL